MNGDFIPGTFQDLLAWSLNFSTLITAAPTDYGLVSGDATAYAALHSTYAAAQAAATDPSTRTASTVADRVTARTALVAGARMYARQVQAFPAITPMLLSDLGLTVRDSDNTAVPAPSSNPVVTVDTIQPGQHILRLVDSDTPDSKAKPPGCGGAEVFVYRGTVAPTGFSDYAYAGLASRFLFTVTHSGGDAGKQAYYLARWVTKTGLTGPNSTATHAVIA